jgi:hypothetical protein
MVRRVYLERIYAFSSAAIQGVHDLACVGEPLYLACATPLGHGARRLAS